jgi:hypothetical protein
VQNCTVFLVFPKASFWHDLKIRGKTMPGEFFNWKQLLLGSAGSASPSIRQLGDHVLELFWEDGCEPTMNAMLDYAQNGLCQKFNIRASERASEPRFREEITAGSRAGESHQD